MSSGRTTQFSEAIERVRVHDHLCLIYETQEEQFAAVVPFMARGLERGEKCVYVVDDNTAEAVLAAMGSGGVDVDSATRSGALTILSKRETYLRDGFFAPERMIDFLTEAAGLAKQEGYAALRATGEMTFMLGGDPGVERLMEYEAKLNYFYPRNDALGICQYNRRRFSPEVIMEVIRTHPLVICGGLVCRNLYYVPPEEYLKPDQVSLQVERLLAAILERERIEVSMKERTAELERKTAELETMLKGFVNRETRMAEMKERIRDLEEELLARRQS